VLRDIKMHIEESMASYEMDRRIHHLPRANAIAKRLSPTEIAVHVKPPLTLFSLKCLATIDAYTKLPIEPTDYRVIHFLR
jgi:hypothetical protein